MASSPAQQRSPAQRSSQLGEAALVDGASTARQFFSNDNLVAAASMIVAMPTLVVYLMLQRQFISGLTLGANKG